MELYLELPPMSRTTDFSSHPTPQPPEIPNTAPVITGASGLRSFLRAVRYLLLRGLLIFSTIFVGVFITILIVNQPVQLGYGTMPPQLDMNLANHIEQYLRSYRVQTPGFVDLPEIEQDEIITSLRAELIDEVGLDLPYLPRHLLWTLKALKFDWGRLQVVSVRPLTMFNRSQLSLDLNDILLQYLPNTLLLVVSSNLLIFLLGLPLALRLANKYGSWLDRALSVIAPISSIPSWVVGILLIAIFSAELKLLPPSGMLDTLPPAHWTGYILIVLKHMILPVLAIFISLFFQLVYTWRTFFVIFSEEDYVTLGKAVGFSPQHLQRKYILKPSLSYVITSFSLMLVSFWQMTMALEVIFRWPGIGLLYIDVGLPNFWGESMYPGELLIAVSLVVMFAYLLGSVVFLLDIIYVLIDPRIRLGQSDSVLRLRPLHRQGGFSWFPRRRTAPTHSLDRPPVPHPHPRLNWADWKTNFHLAICNSIAWLKRAAREVRRYPTAIIGLSMISLMIIGSLYAVIALPHEKIGREWGRTILTGQAVVPKQARPAWFNLFRSQDYLSTLVLDSAQGQAERVVRALPNDMWQITLTYTFDYSYADFPSELFLYLEGSYEEKKPYISMVWTTPDGREINLQGISVAPETSYDFEEYLHHRRIVSENPNWQNWFIFGDIFPTPAYYILFADPQADHPKLVRGQYTLRIDGLTFEPDSDIESRLVMLGQVYGAAGTDYYRRDLLVPLLWGLPFALGFGLAGSLATTLLSMLMAAAGVWFGGWVDCLIQRLTEANMVLPILAIAVLAYAFLGIDLWVVLTVVVLLNVFGMPTKNFRAAFLQIKDATYIEAAQTYGASSWRIISKYLVPRIIPVMIPQMVVLIPGFVFLEATLGLFNINSGYPTWGTVIYQALTHGALYNSRFWVLEPLALLLLTSLAFSMLGIALERILNPRLVED